MPIEHPPRELQDLIDSLAAAHDSTGQVRPKQVLEALAAVTAQTGWLPPDRRRANHDNYARHILWCDPQSRFSILSIVWERGQRSPVHGHRTWCAVGVYQGSLTESSFEDRGLAAAPRLRAIDSRGPGSVSFDAGRGVHRIANHADTPAISIHVYGVGAEAVGSGINRYVCP